MKTNWKVFKQHEKKKEKDDLHQFWPKTLKSIKKNQKCSKQIMKIEKNIVTPFII